ncbi:MAG: hypothetical protein GWO24_09045, partial [Akkermansiaceae bacterium]|nr:hypothetical protein [Akkermansiaceae bacterium]
MTVLEQNDAPVIDLIADRAVHEGTQVSFDVTASDENTGDSLRYTLDSAPTGAWINFWTGRFNWTAADGPGTAVTVRVTDTGNPALSDIDTFTITVDNVAPILTLSGNATVEADAPFQLTLDASDPGSDTITEWEITWGDGAVETLAGNPTSAMHTYDVVGTYEITATATDEDGTFTSNTFTLAVTGDVPIATVLVNGGGTQRTRVSSFEVQFSADVGDAIDDSDLQIRNLTTATNLLPGDWSSSYDPV